MNVGMLLIMVLSKVARGPGGGFESAFGLQICDAAAWLAFVALVAFAALFTFLAAKIAIKEFVEKKNCGYKFTRGDQELTTKNVFKLSGIAFLGAFLAALSGIGPGVVFNSVMIQLDLHPAVASATGMYLVLFTTLSASINLLINEQLNIPYSLWLSLFTIIGTIPGLFAQGWIVRKAGGRNQFTVMILIFILVFCLLTILPLSLLEALKANDDGKSITKVNSFCD